VANDNPKVLGWGKIVLILVAVGFVVGGLLGLINALVGVPTIFFKGGIGAAVGLAAVFLMAQRRAALDRQKNG
jgi:hypothetical protein